jgi:hypothetical protein
VTTRPKACMLRLTSFKLSSTTASYSKPDSTAATRCWLTSIKHRGPSSPGYPADLNALGESPKRGGRCMRQSKAPRRTVGALRFDEQPGVGPGRGYRPRGSSAADEAPADHRRPPVTSALNNTFTYPVDASRLGDAVTGARRPRRAKDNRRRRQGYSGQAASPAAPSG